MAHLAGRYPLSLKEDSEKSACRPSDRSPDRVGEYTMPSCPIAIGYMVSTPSMAEQPYAGISA